MIGVYNPLLSKVFRLYHHSQKVIGSLGIFCSAKRTKKHQKDPSPSLQHDDTKTSTKTCPWGTSGQRPFFWNRSRSESIYGKRSWIQFSGQDGCMSIYLFVCVFFFWVGGGRGKIVSFCFFCLFYLFCDVYVLSCSSHFAYSFFMVWYYVLFCFNYRWWFQQRSYTPQSLTARPWKMMLGRRSFPFGMVYFQGLLLLNFRLVYVSALLLGKILAWSSDGDMVHDPWG